MWYYWSSTSLRKPELMSHYVSKDIFFLNLVEFLIDPCTRIFVLFLKITFIFNDCFLNYLLTLVCPHLWLVLIQHYCYMTANDKNYTLLVNYKAYFFSNFYFGFHCFTIAGSSLLLEVSFTIIFGTLNNWSECKPFSNSLQYAGFFEEILIFDLHQILVKGQKH